MFLGSTIKGPVKILVPALRTELGCPGQLWGLSLLFLERESKLSSGSGTFERAGPRRLQSPLWVFQGFS